MKQKVILVIRIIVQKSFSIQVPIQLILIYGPDHQRQHNCIFQNATLQDLQDIFEYVEDNGYFEYKSETEPKAVKEYCTYEGHKKKKAFCQTLKGILAFKNSICGMSNKQEQCTRVSNALGCLFPILDDYHSQGKC
ncbi:uncharacterized protein LOC129969519 [Argiope bruennichi]|uniref:uncharacterized protein LOC129969519 n=1 Tax=Argiope bruennichi TaxID=94029 RepID=UPI0024942DDE|nr:uncharacterized protein LOC129969519 [Argiope bruennichi]